MMKLIKIGRTNVENIKEYAFDGCHKIYLIESKKDKTLMKKKGWDDTDFYPIDTIEECYRNACPLKFIDFGETRGFETVIAQCVEQATFTYKTENNTTIKMVVRN